MKSKEIVEYRIFLYSETSGSSPHHRATITLFDNMKNCIGSLRFFDPGEPLDDDFEKDGITRIFMPTNMFQNVLDVLRNEKPVYLHFLQNRHHISTNLEPVGEGEQ